jgi:sortase B
MENIRKKLIIILSAAAVLLFAAGLFFVARDYRELKKSQAQLEELKAVETVEYADAQDTSVPDESETVSSAEETVEEVADEIVYTVNPYAESFLANEDMAAWLYIPGTNIDYPVMWTPEDEEYYLNRGFDGSSNKNGCLILDTDSCLNPLTTNLIIHGHNMKSGAMFGTLLNYEDTAFYDEHKEIILYTEECERRYEVLCVFRSQVYKKTDDVFKFYKFFQADTEEEFDYFYKNIMELAEYDTGVTAEFGDNFLTLSTCAYHVQQGRFVVVAKEVETGDYYEAFR